MMMREPERIRRSTYIHCRIEALTPFHIQVHFSQVSLDVGTSRLVYTRRPFFTHTLGAIESTNKLFRRQVVLSDCLLSITHSFKKRISIPFIHTLQIIMLNNYRRNRCFCKSWSEQKRRNFLAALFSFLICSLSPSSSLSSSHVNMSLTFCDRGYYFESLLFNHLASL